MASDLEFTSPFSPFTLYENNNLVRLQDGILKLHQKY